MSVLWSAGKRLVFDHVDIYKANSLAPARNCIVYEAISLYILLVGEGAVI